MKSVKAIKMIKWLNDSTNIIDLPRDFTPSEAKRIIDIAETERCGIDVTSKIKEFKNNWYKDCEIKSEKVKSILEDLKSNLRPEDDLLLSENQVINLVELAESELG